MRKSFIYESRSSGGGHFTTVRLRSRMCKVSSLLCSFNNSLSVRVVSPTIFSLETSFVYELFFVILFHSSQSGELGRP